MPKPKKADAGDGCLFQRKRKGKNGRVYSDDYVIITRDEEGKPVRLPLHTKVYHEAQEKYREWQVARATGDNSAITGRVTVREYLDRWLAAKAKDSSERGTPRPQSLVKYRNYITPFTKYLKASNNESLQIMNIKDTHLKGYQAWRRTQTRFGKPGGVPITPEGINQEVAFFRDRFKEAYRDRFISRDQTKGVERLPTARKQVLLPSAKEVFEVLQATGQQVVKDYAMTIALTGMRAMEGMTRKFKHVDLDRSILHICDDGDFRLKNSNSARDIPLPDEVGDIVLRIRSERKGVTGEGYIFVLPDGSPLAMHKNHAYHAVTRTIAALNKAKRKAGTREIPYFTIRLLRHWFVSWALNRRENPLTETQLIKIVGHADFDMIRRTYYHLDLDGESGRKMRKTPLFTKMSGAAAELHDDTARHAIE